MAAAQNVPSTEGPVYLLGSLVSFDKLLEKAAKTNRTLSKQVQSTSAEVTKNKALQRRPLPYLWHERLSNGSYLSTD